MLTFSNPQSADQTDHYFQKDMNYYLGNNAVLGDITGEASKELGLNGTILTPSNYAMHTMLCNGHYGNERLIQKGSGKKHAAGFDITMADPKEISILRTWSKIKGNHLSEMLDQAHEKAARKTFAFIERYAGYRKLVNGKSTFMRSGKLIASLFQHETNRFDDPHTHTHHFIYNMTLDEKGKWRALENFHLFKNQDLFHQVWHANLALELQELGLQTHITDYKKGTFKIVDFNPEITEHFSQRSQKIEAAYKAEETRLQRDLSMEEKETIKLKLRPQKSKRSLNIVHEEFMEEIEQMWEFDSAYVDDLFNPRSMAHESDPNWLLNIVEEAAEAINETRACFTYEELLKGVLKLTHGKNKTVSIETIETAIANHTELIRFHDDTISTRKFHELEKQIITDSWAGKGTYKSMFEHSSIDTAIENVGLTRGQQVALHHILRAQDTLVGIQGDAGSGKTYMLKWANIIAKEEIEFRGLAFTGVAADEIEKESGIKSTTIHALLAGNYEEDLFKKKRKVWIVDEASMVGSRLLSQLMKKAKEQNAQIVLIGDIKQFQSISAGTIFGDLQRSGAMDTVTMSEVKRQEEQTLINAVAAINRFGDYGKAFDLLNQNGMIQEVVDDDKRIDKAVELYLGRDFDQTLMLAQSNSDRTRLNRKVREHLKIDGKIGDEEAFDLLVSHDIRDMDKSFAQNYHVGQIVVANKQGILRKNGEKGTIVSIDPKIHVLTVKNEDGSIYSISLSRDHRYISVFQPIHKKIGIGERIMFAKNDKILGVKNGQTGIVKRIDGKYMTIEKQGKEIVVDLKIYSFIDYAYAITDIKSQGKTAREVIAVTDAKRVNPESFYVQLTRAKKRLTMLVEDRERFRMGLERGNKENSTLWKIAYTLEEENYTVTQTQVVSI